MKNYKEYFPDGSLKAEGGMKKDKKDGLWTFYYRNGKKCRVVNYKMDIEDGDWVMWHENGNLYIESNKINGKTLGPWKEYYESGNIKETGYYTDDRYAPIDFWDERGNQLLKNGNGKKIEKFGADLIDVYEHYYENGKLIKDVRI